MSVQWSRRCTVALLGAMSIALAIGLLALGPVPLVVAERSASSSGGHAHVADGIAGFIAAALLITAGLVGIRRTTSGRWPGFLKRPLVAFHASVMLAGLASVAVTPAAGTGGAWVGEVALAGASLMLGLACLAEHVDAAWGSPRACRAAGFALAVAVTWAGMSAATSGAFDMRLLILAQCVPLLLLAVGVFRLPAQSTRRVDWIVVLGGCLAARGGEWALGWWRWTEPAAVTPHTVVLAVTAATAAWLAYCAGTVRSPEGGATGSGMRVHRSTSLYTSS